MDVDPQAAQNPSAPSEGGARPGFGQVISHQRKTIIVALVLMVASVWILWPMGKPLLGACLAIGVAMGLINHLISEFWLLKVISSGKQFTRNELAASTILRLTLLTVVALAVAVAFWPMGIGTLLGLAIFRLIALVMTSVPLLKELKSA